jgi:hypothetical protein
MGRSRPTVERGYHCRAVISQLKGWFFALTLSNLLVLSLSSLSRMDIVHLMVELLLQIHYITKNVTSGRGIPRTFIKHGRRAS